MRSRSIGDAPYGSSDSPGESFDEFFERIRPRLLSFVRQRGVPVDHADDIVQDTLLAAHSALMSEKFRGESSLETWVYGILRHKMSDWRQADGRRRQLVAFNEARIDLPAIEVAQGELAGQNDADAVVLVHEVLQGLPARHWLVLMLNQRVGLTTAEIARVIRLSPGRVGAILAEAKAQFRHGVRGEEVRPLKPTK